MSDAQSPRPTYDPNELRRCIALSFSPRDFRTFAENLGVSNLGSWDRGIQDGAREVVRHFERLGTLEQLVTKLAEARPLTEWPAPQAASVVATFPPAPPLAPALPLAPAPPLSPKTLESAAPDTSASAAPIASAPPTVPSPFAPPLEVPPPVVSPPKPIATTISPPEPILRDPFAPAFPGTAGSSATDNKQLEGRKLAPIIAGAVALITIITIGIFLAVRVGKNSEPAKSEVIAGRPLRPHGPARLAADSMRKSLESLARGCDLEVPRGTDVDVWLFAAAYEQCGTRPGIAFPPPGLRVNAPRSTNPPDPADTDDASPNVPPTNTPRQTNPGRDVGPRSAPAPAPAPAPAKPQVSDGCVDKCAATQKQCNRGCGSEPTSSSAYERWQGCQTQCLSTASKCRLACQ